MVRAAYTLFVHCKKAGTVLGQRRRCLPSILPMCYVGTLCLSRGPREATSCCCDMRLGVDLGRSACSWYQVRYYKPQDWLELGLYQHGALDVISWWYVCFTLISMVGLIMFSHVNRVECHFLVAITINSYQICSTILILCICMTHVFCWFIVCLFIYLCFDIISYCLSFLIQCRHYIIDSQNTQRIRLISWQAIITTF